MTRAGPARGWSGACADDLAEDLADGRAMHALIADLYPLCRSITGPGTRQTLRRLRHHVPLDIQEVATGTQVFDWTVPPEWTLRDAYIAAPSGARVVDVRRSSLHVVGYSRPVHARMGLGELRPHLHALPDHPDWLPYRTSYYADAWGFCLPQRVLDGLEEGTYEVRIDSALTQGSLSYGEVFLPGRSADEVLISTHICHPALCNDNLSGIAVAAALAQRLGGQARALSYRFVFVPGTIGSLAWLARNQGRLGRIRAGLVLTCLGDPGPLTYKRSGAGDAWIDEAATYALSERGAPFAVQDFTPYGYDERQYNAPGFRLPVGCLMRTPHGCFPEYHTSADDLDFVTPDALQDSLDACLAIVDVLENDRLYRNRFPYGEPQLGRRGLYAPLGGGTDGKALQLALLWLLNRSDGRTGLLSIARQAGLSWSTVKQAAGLLSEHGLLEGLGTAAPAAPRTGAA